MVHPVAGPPSNSTTLAVLKYFNRPSFSGLEAQLSLP